MMLKRCPTCSRSFADETLSFCLVDGSILSAPYDPQATLIFDKSQLPPTDAAPKAQPVPSNSSHEPTMRIATPAKQPPILVERKIRVAAPLHNNVSKESSVQKGAKTSKKLLYLWTGGIILAVVLFALGIALNTIYVSALLVISAAIVALLSLFVFAMFLMVRTD